MIEECNDVSFYFTTTLLRDEAGFLERRCWSRKVGILYPLIPETLRDGVEEAAGRRATAFEVVGLRWVDC